jgi:hypothetical protein
LESNESITFKQSKPDHENQDGAYLLKDNNQGGDIAEDPEEERETLDHNLHQE